MHLSAAILVYSSIAFAQTKTPDPAQTNDAIHARALATLQAEQSRAKQPLCPNANSTLDINTCDDKEVHLTEANYTKFTRAVSALLRAGNDPKSKASAPIPFDTAEAAWHAYRTKACTAAGSQYEGGSIRPSIEMQCTLTLTRHHMDELWELYSTTGMQ